MSPRLTVKIAAVAALCGAATLILAGCGGNSKLRTSATTPPPLSSPPPTSVPLAALTPISQCIVDSEGDVIIGGPNAKKGCDDVALETDKSNAPAIDQILVTGNGVLTINPPGEQGSSVHSANVRDSGLFAPIYRPVREICIQDGGVAMIGTKEKPITSANKAFVKFYGERNTPTANDLCPSDFHKGIDVMEGGSLLMYGAKGVPSLGGVSWTTLAAPAGSQVPGAKIKSTGPTTLDLTADVTKGSDGGWQPGDWIVIATTDYDPVHSEFVQIAGVKSVDKDGGGSIVTLNANEPLKYYHFGSLPPSPASASCPDPLHATLASAPATQPAFLCDGPDRNYGVDERAEVGLISRDIVLTSETEPVTTVPPSATSSVYWGGEITIHQGFKQVVIQGVRLSKFGKDRLGSYPIHFHMAGSIGPDQTALIDADSIDHSYNKCVTIHSTSNLTISNLVCARIVGHIFYEELMNGPLPEGPGNPPNPPASPGSVNPAADADIVFNHDLGIGAMSNSFDVYAMADKSRQALIGQYWWAGDYMTNAQCATDSTCIQYDGFNIPDTDNQHQSTHGACYKAPQSGSNTGFWVLAAAVIPRTGCPAGTYYLEPASGFWIQNPGTVLTNDAIAGCQGDGVAYWWVPPPDQIKVEGVGNVDLKLNPLGEVRDDRSSACYHGYFAEGENGVSSGQLSPVLDGVDRAAPDSPNIIAHVTGLTATHSRWRALWLRGTATWFVVKDGHFADDNRGATLVTSGGVDGNGPGIWQRIEDSVFVGMSQDNVGRWGPCPKINVFGPTTGFDFGCIDYSYPQSGAAHSGELLGKGYPGPDRNSYGYQIYDGPALMYHLRFVNYNYNSDQNAAADCNGATPDPTHCAFSVELDQADRVALGVWDTLNSTGYHHYEGDAALGWFPANQNAYPTATATRQLQWVNTNLRHQIFTDHVKIDSTFGDGDKNTAIVDEDGTLSGFGVITPDGTGHGHVFSLNNLPFNATSNSVDECFSRGAQNEAIEGRDSSLMSPTAMGTLEFANLYPWKTDPPFGADWPGGTTTHWQTMTFTRTDEVQGQNGTPFHPSMSLNSRAGQGYWEPKVSNGYAYTVTVSPSTTPNAPCNQGGKKCTEAGIYKWIDVGVADVLDPNISKAHPFYVLLGIDYASVDANGDVLKPTGDFTIKRGYKSYFGGVFYQGLTFPGGKNNDIYNSFTLWTNCNGLDGHRPGQAVLNIPYQGKAPGCPAGGTDAHTGEGSFPVVTTLTAATSFAALTKPDGTPNLDQYYYNPQTGYLWLNIAQDEPNAPGSSPIGSCDKNFDGGNPDPACPETGGENYYICPKNGCIIYTIALNDPNYKPGTSPGYAQLPPANLPPAPAKQNQLVWYGTDSAIDPEIEFDKVGEPFHVPADGQSCKLTQPAQSAQ